MAERYGDQVDGKLTRRVARRGQLPDRVRVLGEELANRVVERLRFFEMPEVTAVLQDDKPGTGDARMQHLGPDGAADKIVPAGDDEGAGVDRGELVAVIDDGARQFHHPSPHSRPQAVELGAPAPEVGEVDR